MVSSRMKTLRLFAAWMLLTGMLCAQEPQPAGKDANTPSSFRSRAELVLVPTVVLQKGKPVTGLKPENFVVEEDGKEQKIAVFESIETLPRETKPLTPKRANQNSFSNIDIQEPARAMTLIAIDGVNTPLMSQEQARKQVLGFLAKNLTPDQLIGIVVITSKGVQIVQDFTRDTPLLIAALEKATGQSNRYNAGLRPTVEQQTVKNISTDSPSKAVLDLDNYDRADPTSGATVRTIDQNLANFVQAEAKAEQYGLAVVIQRTLESFQQIAQGLAGYPGKKNVVWASAGFVYPLDPQRFNNMAIMDLYTRTMRKLSDANVAVYPVDIHGIQATPGADSTYSKYDYQAGVDMNANYKSASLRMDTFRDFAEKTGGRPYFDPTMNQRAFEEIMADSRTYYMIGFYLDRASSREGWHKVKVKLRNADGHVQARSGFFVTPVQQDADQIRKMDLAVGARSPFDYTSIPIQVSWADTDGVSGVKKKVGFDVHVLPSASLVNADQSVVDMDFVAVARKASTEVGGQNSKSIHLKLRPQDAELIRGQGINYKSALELEPGRYNVRFLVRDNITGRMGSVEAPITVN